MNARYLSFIFICFISNAFAQTLYDPGAPNTPMGKQLVDIVADIPNMGIISPAVMGTQKFRTPFGPVYYRMLLTENGVKILFIGQDATHVAEAANRTATAGFGGRAQDLAAYKGVNEGAGFINASAFTIKGQMAAFETPYIQSVGGKDVLKFGTYTDNELWLLMQHQDSEWVKWRNRFIDWIIRNNKDSLQMVVTFGGAARDSMASFIIANGGEVGTNLGHAIKDIQVPETVLKYAGGNNEFPVLLDKDGKDLYAKMMGQAKLNYEDPAVQKAIIAKLKQEFPNLKDDFVLTRGGPLKNGILHPAQMGGFDFDQIKINGEVTRSLKGLPLSDKSVISRDILVLELPHPTFLSNQTPEDASKLVAEKLKVIQPYVDKGYKIVADPGMENRFALGQPYKYARTDLPDVHYSSGTPASRKVAVSSASRMSGKAHVIVFGTRERADFDVSTIDNMTNAKPATEFGPDNLYTARPQEPELRYLFDSGPGDDIERIITGNLDNDVIFKPKEGKTFSKRDKGKEVIVDGIDALNVKVSVDHGDYGHYRGTWKDPEIMILADPQGYDDLITSRAMTGQRGQHLQGLMNDIGVGDKHLVLRTVPYAMDGATADEWAATLKNTETYREKMIEKALDGKKPKVILADGANAQAEIQRILKKMDLEIPVVNVKRGRDFSKDMLAAADELKELYPKAANATGKMANIPRTHLPFEARIWEGTSGDNVITAVGKYRGIAMAEVAPGWAFNQKFDMARVGAPGTVERKILLDNNLPLPGESMPDYLKRANCVPDALKRAIKGIK